MCLLAGMAYLCSRMSQCLLIGCHINFQVKMGERYEKSNSIHDYGRTVETVHWSELPHINNIKEFSLDDAQCLREVYQVLKRYNQHNRFGIALLHKHFEINEDEALLETTNETERTQTIRPIKKSQIAGEENSMMATVVKLSDEDGILSMLNCVNCRVEVNKALRCHSKEDVL